ncbi:hypothetical protein RDABS01_011624, partial [Bienertia sinuspersici]
MKEVRSGEATSSNTQRPNIWEKVWKAQVPPKILNFGWRALHGCLPVKVKLMQRGLGEDGKCKGCGEEVETVFHCLVKCPIVRNIWYLSPLRLDSKKVRQNSFKEWCYSLMSNFKLDEWWNIFWSILWGIWLQRNAWVFERKKRDAMDVIKKAIGVVGEYIQANEEAKSSYNDNRSPSKWHPPGEGYYKVNADAAMLEKNRVGIGAVMRDREGDVMASTCKQILGEYDVEVAEALAARHALQVALEIGLTKIILEVDNLKLCQYLKKDKKAPTGFASQCTDISFSHVKREGNKVAHHLAKLSGNFGELRVWIEEVPEMVQCH